MKGEEKAGADIPHQSNPGTSGLKSTVKDRTSSKLNWILMQEISTTTAP
jgi:hypothetical protein